MAFSLAQIQAIYEWIPKTFNGTTYPAVWSDQWTSAATPPILVLTLTPTGRFRFFDSFLHANSVTDDEGKLLYDEVWGYHEKATLSIDFQTKNPAERDEVGHAIAVEILRNRLKLTMVRDKLRVDDILQTGMNTSYIDSHGNIIYRSVSDIQFEGELGYSESVPAIRRFGVDIGSGGSPKHLQYVIQDAMRVGFGISARLVYEVEEDD